MMQFLFEHRVATREQIGRRFFKGRGRSTIQERLQKLFLANYLTKASVLLKSKWTVAYGLDDKALDLVGNTYRFPVTNPMCKSDSVNHDLNLVDLRESLEHTKMLVDYMPENVLQACGTFHNSEEFRPYRQLNSDAVLILNTTAGRFNAALEYESSPKAPLRYAKKLRDYYLAQQVEAVFYVCRDASIERIIRQAEAEVAPDFEPKVFTCLQETIQRGVLPLPFINRKNGRFSMS